MIDNPSTAIQGEPAVFVPPKERARVSIDAESWQQIDRLLGELPYRTAAPIVAMIVQNGGVK
jgi:hypothetical protein